MISLAEAAGRDVSRETLDCLAEFQGLLIEANRHQNLISKASEADSWGRHIVDSAQLLKFAPADLDWVDVGSGPGLPGLVLALIDPGRKSLVEPRRLRTEFVHRMVAHFGLTNVDVVEGKAEAATARADVITARAVGSPGELLAMTSHLRHAGTIYVLPRGRGAKSELDALRNSWQGEFRLVPSVTTDEALILVASRVEPVRPGRAR